MHVLHEENNPGRNEAGQRVVECFGTLIICMAEVQETSHARVQDTHAEVNRCQITKGLNSIIRRLLQTQQEASGCSSAEEGNDIYLKTIDPCCCRETVLGWFH